MMTWNDLAIQMMKLTVEEMKHEIIIVKDGVIHTANNLLINKNLIANLNDGEPYLEIE